MQSAPIEIVQPVAHGSRVFQPGEESQLAEALRRRPQEAVGVLATGSVRVTDADAREALEALGDDALRELARTHGLTATGIPEYGTVRHVSLADALLAAGITASAPATAAPSSAPSPAPTRPKSEPKPEPKLEPTPTA